MRYRTAAHSRYTIFYHLVFLPKYRQKVLTNLEIEKELKATIKKMAPFHDWVIREMETDKDHIHLLLSAPPRYSISKIVKLIKTWTQKRLFEKYPKKVKQYLWGGRFWAQGFYVSTVSDRTTKEEIKKYIKNQKKELKQLGLFNKN
jgi:putative transposase